MDLSGSPRLCRMDSGQRSLGLALGSPRLLPPTSPRFSACEVWDTPAFLGAVKADILSLQKKLDHVQAKQDPGLAKVTRVIADLSCSAEPLADAHAKLRLLELRDERMVLLEQALLERYEGFCGRSMRELLGPKEPAAPALSRLPSYLRLLQLLLSLAEFRQNSGDHDQHSHDLEDVVFILRGKIAALEKENAELTKRSSEAIAGRQAAERVLQGLDEEHASLLDGLRKMREGMKLAREEYTSLQRRIEATQEEYRTLKASRSRLQTEVDALRDAAQAARRTVLRDAVPCDRCAVTRALLGSTHQEYEALRGAFHHAQEQKDRLDHEVKELRTKLCAERQQVQALHHDHSALTQQHKLALETIEAQGRAALQLRSHYLDIFKGQLMQAEAGERLALCSEEQHAMDRLAKDVLRVRAECAEAQVLSLSMCSLRLPHPRALELDSDSEVDDEEEPTLMPSPSRIPSVRFALPLSRPDPTVSAGGPGKGPLLPEWPYEHRAEDDPASPQRSPSGKSRLASVLRDLQQQRDRSYDSGDPASVARNAAMEP